MGGVNVESSSPLPAILFVAIAALVVAGIAFSVYRTYARRKELAAFAAAHGLSFDPSQTSGFEDLFPDHACLRQGEDDRYAFNVLRGAWDSRPITAFDYHYVTYSTDQKGNRETNHHAFSAVILESAVPLRPLAIRRENVLDKIAHAVGFEDIEFESDEFNRQFAVKSPDRRWAYDVIHQRMMEYLLATPRALAFEMGTGTLIAYQSSTISVPDFESTANAAAGILARLPDYLVEQQIQKTNQGGIA